MKSWYYAIRTQKKCRARTSFYDGSPEKYPQKDDAFIRLDLERRHNIFLNEMSYTENWNRLILYYTCV